MFKETNLELSVTLRRIAEEARAANEYYITLTGTRPDHSHTPNVHNATVDATEWQHLLDTTFRSIQHAVWRPGYAVHPRDSRFVRIAADTHNRGISVTTSFNERSQHLVGLHGDVRPISTTYDPSDLRQLEVHAYSDENAVVAKVLEFIEEAYAKYAQEHPNTSTSTKEE